MKSLLVRVLLSTITLCILPFTGCTNKPLLQPNLVVSQNPSNPSQSTSTISFGDVNVTTSKPLELVIRNKGNGSALLNGISISGNYVLSLNKESTSEKLTYQNCTIGMEIPKDGNCSILVEFVPNAVSSQEGQLTINYAKKENNDPRKEEVALTGKGILNCSINPDMQAKYEEGSQVATQRNTTEFTNGENAGLALTQDQGYADGYAQTYQTNYDSSYNTAYEDAYDIAYLRGFTSGYNNASSCSAGSSDGQTDGFIDGKSVGYSDGYKDGYADGKSTALRVGYNNGYNAGLPIGRSNGLSDGRADGEDNAYDDGYDTGYYNGDSDGYDDGYYAGYDYGYDSGYSDGAYSCKKSDGRITLNDIEKLLKNKSQKLGADASLFLTACYNSGFNNTYNPNSFDNGYTQGSNNNEMYQAGLTQGRNDGKQEGMAEGRRAGQQAGDTEGQSDGVIAGKEAIYEDCYANAYAPAYLNGYSQGYAQGDDKGYKDGYDDYYVGAYNSGYNAGYNVGYDGGYSDGYYTGNNSTTAYNSGYNSGYTYGYNSGYDDGYDYGYDSGYSSGYYDGQDDYCTKTDVIADQSKIEVPFTAILHTKKFSEEDLKDKIKASFDSLAKDQNGIPTESKTRIDPKYKVLPEVTPTELYASGGEIELNGTPTYIEVFKQIEIPNASLLRAIELPVQKLPAAIGKHSGSEDRESLEGIRSLEDKNSLRSFLKARILEQRFFAPLRLKKEEVAPKSEKQRREAAKNKVKEENK